MVNYRKEMCIRIGCLLVGMPEAMHIRLAIRNETSTNKMPLSKPGASLELVSWYPWIFIKTPEAITIF